MRKITARYFPEGFSILDVKGGWFDSAKGKFVKEEARQLLSCTPSYRTVRKWAGEIAAPLKQKELLIVGGDPAT